MSGLKSNQSDSSKINEDLNTNFSGTQNDKWHQDIQALYDLLANLYGSDKLVLKAIRLEALELMKSERIEEQILGLYKLAFDDPMEKSIPSKDEIQNILYDIEDHIADLIARRSIKDRLDKVVADKIEKRQEDYLKELKAQILKESESTSIDNAQTFKKLAFLEKKNQIKLANSCANILRPKSVEEVIGQEWPMKSLLAKLATPYPQHILIYGPPGVGKTSAARVALETVKGNRNSPFLAEAPFIEVDGTTLRWDPRDVTNPLLGSVHDPIYQGAKKDLADTGIPEPKMGLVSDAHGGILFIDEIGEMDTFLLNKLLKVLEDKRVFFDSSYYDPLDPNVPLYIKKLFDEGAPADFVLIGATTRDPSEINPALRSRCTEVFFNPLEPNHIKLIVQQAAEKLNTEITKEATEIISNYVIEGRKANTILTDAYSLARFRKPNEESIKVAASEVQEILRSARITPNVPRKAQDIGEVGRTLGLGVHGFVGSVLEIEAIVFKDLDKKGVVRFNETAGSMARDSVFNATSVIRLLTGEDMRYYDIHVNVVGGGKIDGPSAGCAMTIALYSAVKGIPLKQNIAITGEISIQGKIRPVGGIIEKIFGAKQAGVKTVLIPKENESDVPSSVQGIDIIPIATIQEAIDLVVY